MKIGIDARLIHETGVGRYIRNLIEQLNIQDEKNLYIVYLSKNAYDHFTLPNTRWQKRLATPKWHTIWEQLVMPILFLKDDLDLLHVPYFNIPVLYPKKFIMTVHDLTILHMVTGKATRLPYPLYRLKLLAYQWILQVGVKKAFAIIAPSYTTKKEIIDHFHIPQKKIFVTYEGVDERIIGQKSKNRGHETMSREQKAGKKPYFLYVGNAYPHKNLELLVSAFADFLKTSGKKYDLLFVGKDDYFYQRLKKEVATMGLSDAVHFLESVDDETLHDLYTHALALVFPSFMEGFGLPALEAMSLGTKIMCSDIPIFHEILGSLPRYVDPYDKKSIVKGLSDSKEEDHRMSQKEHQIVLSRLEKYSWEQLGKETLALYTASQKDPSVI